MKCPLSRPLSRSSARLRFAPAGAAREGGAARRRSGTSAARSLWAALAGCAIVASWGCWSAAGTASGTGGAAGGPAVVVDAGGAGVGGLGTGGMIATAPGVGGGGGQSPRASCDAIGDAPTIPAACATVMATRTVTAGIPTNETTLDTVAIQAAIDACTAGLAVRLVTDGDNVAFLTGPLFLKAGITLWIDTGVTLFASRNPRDFDARPMMCAGTNSSADCYAVINVSSVGNAAVMGAGTIDGRGGELIIGNTLNWWDLEDADAGNLVAPRLVWVKSGSNFVLYGVTLKNAAKFHVVIERTIGFKVWGITINTPATSPNTDGVDPSASTNGIIAYNKISTGDDNIAIKASSPPIVDNIVIAHNHFGRGHGMSIGSETNGGVQNVAVCDLSLDGAQNGLRIKSDASRGGVVRDISYTDVCMRGVSNPLVFDSYYSSATGTLIPWFTNITMKNVHNLGGGKLTFRGWDAAHIQTLTLDNVVFDAQPSGITASNTALTFGPGPVNIAPSGATNVTVNRQVTGTDAPRDCTNAWATF
jgi:polygalacturonase